MNIFVVAAHPDDEVIGLGGTLAKHSRKGDKVYVTILSEGEALKLPNSPKCSERREEGKLAGEILGVEETYFLDIPDQEFESIPLIGVIKPIEYYIESIRPDMVFVHHRGDANTDHQIAFKATYAACRAMNNPFIHKILCYETLSSTEQAPQFPEYNFNPNVFVDITAELETKMKALQAYASELKEFPHPRSLKAIEAAARRWGSWVGVEAAEAFMLLREVVR